MISSRCVQTLRGLRTHGKPGAIILEPLRSVILVRLTTPTWYRLCLNFKGIPYKTEWVEWPDIKGVYEKHGIEATSRNPDGSSRYTLPVIHDPSTGVTISDSFVIAEYLDKTYPMPQIFPHHTQGLQAPFEGAFMERTRVMLPFVIPEICAKLTPVSQAVYIPQREKMFGKTIAEVLPKGEAAVEGWNKYKDGLEEVARWYAKTDGPFLLGDTISWADFVVASSIMLHRTLWGKQSQQWQDVTTWHDGCFGDLIKEVDQYSTVVGWINVQLQLAP
jgi:glutathione S-transferase